MRYRLKQIIVTMLIVVLALSGVTIYNEPMEVYAADAFEASISDFPSSYRGYLRELHAKYPNWKFEPLYTGLDWNTVVKAETNPVSTSGGNISLVAKSASNLLKRNESCDYNTKTGQYIYKDSTSWVSANSNTVAYFLDPRNFLNEVNVFQFEKNSYDKSVHTLTGVKKILQGTFMDASKGDFSYLDTKGKSVKAKTTYAEEIFNAGQKIGVSPYFLASKIRQEVGGYAQPSGSVSGKYTSKDGRTKFVGYYNFYNIGANDGADPITNGLNYAKKTDASLLLPWNTPMKAIEGGSRFFYNNYIKSYQNTGYLVRFNVDKRSNMGLYRHQFMTNISGAGQETSTTYNAYKNIGNLKDAKVFLIPIYNNMPSMTNKISITSAKGKVGTAKGSLNVRSGPGISYSTVYALKNNEKVTIIAGQRANTGYSYDNLKYPYWYQVKYKKSGKDYTGYVYCESLNVKVKKSIMKGQTYTIPTSRTTTSDTVYYLSDNPAVATVNAKGKVTARKKGEVNIYAFLASGKMDSIKIKVADVSLNYSAKSMYLKAKLKLKVSGVTADTSVSWSSSNKKVATVDKNGIVIAKAIGKVTITAKASSGIYAKAKITVIPKKPVLAVSKFSYDYVSLKWSRPSKVTGYEIYRSTSGKRYQKISTIKKSTTLKYTDKDLINGTSYKYRIRAYKKVGSQTYYSRYTYVTYKAKPKATKITSAKSVKGKHTVQLKWQKQGGSSGYVLYRRELASKKYIKISTVSGNKKFSYKDTSVKRGKTYYYRVRIYRMTKGKKIYGSCSKTVAVLVK